MEKRTCRTMHSQRELKLVLSTISEYSKLGPYVLSGGPLIFNVILFKRKAVYTEGAGPVCKCTGQCTLEGCILLF